MGVNGGEKFFELKVLYFLIFMLVVPGLYAAVPINERSLQGAAVAEARQKLLTTAESYLGTPYRYAGLDRKGLDCSGLVYLSFKESLNFTIPRTAESIYDWVEKIDAAELQPGDLVFFVTTGPGISHLGIYGGDGKFIHAASEGPRTGVMYSRLDEAYWKRTYKGAGRALPWDENKPYTLADSGFFTGMGASWNWGGFFEGAASPFRGISAQVSAGYKWSLLRAGLEFRPEWDRALGVFRLPFTLSMGTDFFQVFAGPAYTFGEPSLALPNGERYYSGGGAWLWEAGLSAAVLPIKMNRGTISLYGELAWQPYHSEAGKTFEFKPDITANLRASTGLRYFWYPQ